MSDPLDEERRRPSPENDSDWPERDLWQSWDRPAEPEPEAEAELPWTDAEGDELWSDSVGSRPVSTTPWTGPTWDAQPWAEPSPGERRPDLSAFIGPAEVGEVAEAPEVEPREPDRQEPEPQEPPPRAAVEDAQPAQAQPISSAWESLGLSDPTREPAADPAWTAPDPIAAVADVADVAEPAWSAPEPAAEPGRSDPEPVPERFEDQGRAPAEQLSEPPEPAEQAFAAFAPQHEPEFVPEPTAVAAEAEPDREPEPQPEAEPEPSRPYEPFEVIDGGAMAGSFDSSAGEIETMLGAEHDWDGRSERRQPTTAEQVVPWLIGVILLLAGMVIVLMALIFTSDNGVLAGLASPSAGPNDSAGVGVVPSADPAATPSQTPAASSGATATSKPSSTPKPAVPTFGPLEMVYLGRSAALAHIYLLRHDFTADQAPVVLAQDPAQDVEHLSWSSDGADGAAIIAGRLVTIEEGKPKRALADGVVASALAPDGKTIYALRIVLGNGTDRAGVLQITYASGALKKLTEWTYPRPVIGAESAVKEAQFADEGGSQRLYWMSNGTLRIWMLGAPTYGVTTTGRATKLAAATLPALWSGDGIKRIQLTESGEITTISLRSGSGKELAKATVEGLVSHLRWSPDDSQVVFTLGRSVGGGVQQDLFLWNLSADKPPMQLTNTGAAFGAEWLGTAQSWRP